MQKAEKIETVGVEAIVEVEVETEVGSVVGIIQIEEVDTEEEVVVAMEVAKDDMMMVVNIT